MDGVIVTVQAIINHQPKYCFLMSLDEKHEDHLCYFRH